MIGIKIDPEFQALIPPLQPEELQLLEEQILRDGVTTPLNVWNGILIDGHNRLRICQKHNLTYQTVNIELKDRNEAGIWIIKNQLGRRNLTDAQKAVMGQKMEPLIAAQAKQRQKEAGETHGRGKVVPTLGQPIEEPIEPASQKKTDAIVAKAVGLGQETYRKAKKVLNEGSEEVKTAYLEGKVSTNKAYQETVGKPKDKPKAKPRMPKSINPPTYPIIGLLKEARALILVAIENDWKGSESRFTVVQEVEGLNYILNEERN